MTKTATEILLTNGDGAESASLVDRIESDLLAGRFRAGEWLKQADIEASYGANRFDVRMALLDLKARHLLDHERNRGFRVVNLTDREREQLIETRTIVETAAVRMAVERATADDIAELRAIVRDFEQNMATADLDALRVLNGLFHDKLYGACGNAVLTQEIKALRQRGMPGVTPGGSWRTFAGISRSHEDHLQMVECLERRDAHGLARIVEQHLNQWRDLKAAGI